jgi:drug/metabolite transporter (DMT)-like permease
MPAASPSSASAKSNQLGSFLLLVAGTTALGNSSVLVRYAAVDPSAAAFWRVVTATPFLLLWVWLENRYASKSEEAQPVGWTAPDVLWPSVAAGVSFALDLWLSNIALGLTTMTSFIILVHLAPVIVVVVAWFWFREKLTPMMLVALVLAVGGAALLVQSGRAQPIAKNAFLGDLASIAAAFGYAGFILAMRRARMRGGAGLVSLISAVTCAVAAWVISVLSGESLWPLSAWSFLMLAIMGALCHAFGQGTSAYAVRSLGASITSIVLVYGVAVTVFGGWWFFGEVPSVIQLLGGVMVIAAVILCRPR